MGLFARFKMLFNKNVSILPHQRNDMVSFVKLRNGSLKIGSEIVVDDNFNFVIVHYNKVCDVLRPGTYKVDEVNVPKLYKYSKALFTKKGMFMPKTIKTDAYFINLTPFKLNAFKTPERIIVKENDQKIKIKLEGTFTLRVVDSEKVMKALCNDYAVITNKKAMKEIKATIGFDVSKILNSKDFSLQDYLKNKEKITEVLNSEINKYVDMYGLEIGEFFISTVIVPKKNTIEKPKEEVLEGESNIDIVKLVEERLNDLENNFAKVESGSSKENMTASNNFVEGNTSIDRQGNVVIDLSKANNEEVRPNSVSNSNNENNDGGVFSMPYSKVPETTMFNFGTEQKAPSIFEEETKEEIKTVNGGVKGNAQSVIKNGNGATSESKSDYKINTYNTGVNENYNKKENLIEKEVKEGERVSMGGVGPVSYSEAYRNEKMENDIKDSESVINGIVDYFVKQKKNFKGEYSKDLELFKVKVGREKAESIISLKGKSFKTCKSCGEVIDEKAKFCSRCGKSTAELVVCPCCGAKNFPEAKICCVCKSDL